MANQPNTDPDAILIPIRYGDLDPQGHVNNARVLTFSEQARMIYLQRLKLWDGADFSNLGIIVADTHVTYHAQICIWQTVRVTAHVTRLGNKSLRFEHHVEDAETRERLASVVTVVVAYDYHQQCSVTIWDEWRQKIAAYEGIPLREG